MPRPRPARSTRRARGSIDSEPPWIRARRARMAASSPRNPGRSTPRRRSVSAGMPSSGSTSADRMCSASRIGLSRRWAVAWAATMASWAFWVKRSSCIGGLVSGVEGSRQRGSGWLTRSKKVRAAALASSERSVGRTTRALTYRSPWPVGLEAGHALAGQPERPAGLGAGGDRQQDAALERLDLDLAAEQGLLEGQRQLALEVGAAPGEPRVGHQADDDDEVAAAGAALAQLDPGAGVGARRDRDLEPLAVDLDQAGRAVVRLGRG